MHLDEVLMLALRVYHALQINLKMKHGMGRIISERKKIVSAVFISPDTHLRGEEALKEIIKHKDEIEKLDILPVSGKVEREFECDVHCLMKIMEEVEAQKNVTSWVDEFLLNLASMDSNWVIYFKGRDFSAKLFLKNRRYVNAEYVDASGKLEGEEAFKKIMERRTEIMSGKMEPLQGDIQEVMDVNFFHLLSSFS